jgi:hypothetical protein
VQHDLQRVDHAIRSPAVDQVPSAARHADTLELIVEQVVDGVAEDGVAHLGSVAQVEGGAFLFHQAGVDHVSPILGDDELRHADARHLQRPAIARGEREVSALQPGAEFRRLGQHFEAALELFRQGLEFLDLMMLAAGEDGDFLDPAAGQQFVGADKRLARRVVVAQGDQGAKRRLRIDRADRPLPTEHRPNDGVATAQAELRAPFPIVRFELGTEQRVEHQPRREVGGRFGIDDSDQGAGRADLAKVLRGHARGVDDDGGRPDAANLADGFVTVFRRADRMIGREILVAAPGHLGQQRERLVVPHEIRGPAPTLQRGRVRQTLIEGLPARSASPFATKQNGRSIHVCIPLTGPEGG